MDEYESDDEEDEEDEVSCILGNSGMLCCCLLIFFKINFLKKKLSGTLSECQTALVQIWVQTVCKGYQQTTKLAASKGRVKIIKFQIQIIHHDYKEPE